MSSAGTTKPLRIGELATRTGLTARALRHYDEIGLLSPSRHTGSGYRLYGPDEIVRLQQIVSLRQLGFALDEIRDILARPETSLAPVIELQLMRLNEQIVVMEQLRTRLEALAHALRANGSVTSEALFETMEAIQRMETYYTPEQLKTLEERRRRLGDEHIRQVEAEWPELIAKVQAEYDNGTGPADPRVQALAKRWMELVHEFTGGDPGIAQSVSRVWQEESNVHGIETGPMRELMGYVGQALQADQTE